MILSIPVCYRATVVRAGCRKDEDVLLAAQTHVRIPESQDLGPAVRIHISPRDRLRGVLRHSLSEARFLQFEDLYTSEGEDGTELYAALRLPMNFAWGSPQLDGACITALGEEAVGLGRETGLFFGRSAWPFQSEEAIAWDPQSHSRPDFQIYPENTDFRSCIPAVPEARNIAFAFANRAAAELRVDPQGMIWKPTTGPKLVVRSHHVSLHAPEAGSDWSPFVELHPVFRVDELDAAIAMAMTSVTPDAPLRVDGFTAEVLRPAAYCWNSTPRAILGAVMALMDRVVSAVQPATGYEYTQSVRSIWREVCVRAKCACESGDLAEREKVMSSVAKTLLWMRGLSEEHVIPPPTLALLEHVTSLLDSDAAKDLRWTSGDVQSSQRGPRLGQP